MKFFYTILIMMTGMLQHCSPGAAKGRHILTLGDSNGTFPWSWPQQIRNALPGSTVVNISRSGRTIGFVNNGDTSLNSLMVLQTNLNKAMDSAQGRAYDYIVMELGTNDAKAVFADRQKEVPGNLERLIKGIQDDPSPLINKAQIIVIAPPPYGSKADTTAKYGGGNARVLAMSKAFKEVANRNHCVFIDGYHTPGLNMETMTPDGLHLDSTGSKLLIKPLIKLLN